MKPSEKIETGYSNNTDEIRKMILENPEIPILVFAGENAACDDYRWTDCRSINIKKGEFLNCRQEVNAEITYVDRIEFKIELEDYLWSQGIEGDDLEAAVENEMAEYKPYWKPCLILYVDN